MDSILPTVEGIVRVYITTRKSYDLKRVYLNHIAQSRHDYYSDYDDMEAFRIKLV
jgi:hypothetical protein